MEGTPYSFFVQFHVTERCNLRCRHCYQSKAVPQMESEEIYRAIDNIGQAIRSWVRVHGMDISPSFHFTGGEPFLRNDLFSIIAYARSRGFSVSLMSNGTLVDEDLAGQVRAAGVDDVQVSLDGLGETHDALRGRGSFERALKGIRNLLARGVDTNINVTVSKLNVGEVEGLVRLAEEVGAGGIAFSRLVPSGRGAALIGQALTPPELAAFFDRLTVLQQKSRVAVVSRDPLFSVAGMKEVEVPQAQIPVAGCAAGMFGVTIAADGTITPCRRMDLPVGNIRTDDFRELWAESPVLWSLRTQESYSECRECRYWAVCRGCRAVALGFSRVAGKDEYLGADPQCPYREIRVQ